MNATPTVTTGRPFNADQPFFPDPPQLSPAWRVALFIVATALTGAIIVWAMLKANR